MASKVFRLGALALGAFTVLVAAQSKPNILVILSDDQDNHMGTIERMPLLQQYIIDKGATHPRHYCTVSQCCPSRASLWTGKHAHNHNVTDVNGAYGGYPQVVREGVNDDYLPIWLQNGGYNTYYAGKLWNQHSSTNYNNPPAKGWTATDFLIGPNVYVYFNASFTRNFATPNYYPGEYSTDLVANKSLGFLQTALNGDKPWFLVAAPVGPHCQAGVSKDVECTMPPPATRHQGLFQDYQIPRTPDFNPDTPGGAAYYKDLPKLSNAAITYNDQWQRHRLRALQSVDELVETLVKEVEDAGQADNTYIFYTSDNGYHLSQHRLPAGKNCGLETDINIPFFVRGPGIEAGSTVDTVSAHVDMSPTIMELAGLAQHDSFDGAIMPFTGADTSSSAEHVNIEHWGRGLIEGRFGTYNPGSDDVRYLNNTFKSLRMIGEDYSLYYSVWCIGDHEYYDMTNDPYQLTNLYNYPDQADSYTFKGRNFNQLQSRLDALLMVLKTCTGDTCRQPWSTLFPGGAVNSLADALAKKYDNFFANQPKVTWEVCDLGYIKEVEGPMDVNAYPGSSSRRGFDWESERGWSVMT